MVLGGLTAVAATSLAWRSLNRAAVADEADAEIPELAEVRELVPATEVISLERLAVVEAELMDAEQFDGDPDELMPLAG